MRNYLFVALALTGACKWTDFDDLEETTWVRSTQDPEVGGTEYGIALVGASVGASGGTLAVISDDSPNFSILSYNSAGDVDVGSNPVKLTQQQISVLSDNPVFVADASGRIGLVERSAAGGSFVVFTGPATGTQVAFDIAVMTPPAPAPDAAVFVPGVGGANDLLFAAGNTLYTVPAAGGTPIACTGTDNNSMPLTVAAMAADASNLWVWTKSGALISFPLTALSPCNGGSLPAPGANAFTPAEAFAPGAGSRIHIKDGYAILTGHPATSTTGHVYVVQLSNLTGALVKGIAGMRTTVLATFSSGTYLAVSVPDRNVEGVASGEVDLYELTPATGELTESTALSLHDAEPESGQQFGRSLATMMFNGNEILVVGAKDEIFAYYKTSLYDHLP